MLEKELMKFIDNSPCNFWAIQNLIEDLKAEGYQRLEESDSWKLKKGGKYFLTRNGSAIIAFRIPKNEAGSFMITASHSDSPCFKVKNNPEIDVHGKYTKLSVEPYGGMIMSSWFDRPLSLAGRVVIKTENGIETRLVNIDRDILMFPNQAIHMNREINNGYQYKKHIDLVPLWSDGSSKGNFKTILAKEITKQNETKSVSSKKIAEEDILDYELVLYNRMKCVVWGDKKTFISGPRLDDLECAFISMKAFMDAETAVKESDNIALNAKTAVKESDSITSNTKSKKLSKKQAFEKESIPVCCIYDNEEVGSQTRQGAGSTFLKDTMKRIVYALNKSEDDYLQMVASSYLVSADNAHAVHPNFPEVSDAKNRCYMNDGIVIKYQAAQKYATDALSAAIFKEVADKAGVAVQTFANRSDIAGGSTLGNISTSQVPVRTVDIGLAQLAMHSSYETAGVKDVDSLYKVLKKIFGMQLTISAENYAIKLN